jgi:hypothetical protein
MTSPRGNSNFTAFTDLIVTWQLNCKGFDDVRDLRYNLEYGVHEVFAQESWRCRDPESTELEYGAVHKLIKLNSET